MHDIRSIRDNPDAFDAALAKRGGETASSDILVLDALWRGLAQSLQTALARRNDASKAIGAAMAAKDAAKAESLKSEVSALKGEIAELEIGERVAQAALQDRLASLPNLPAEDVPVGPRIS
jgi:seryl-tRNA synthetase